MSGHEVRGIHVEVTEEEIKRRFRKPDDLPVEEYNKAVFEKMMKKFSRKVVKSGHLKKYMEHEYFVKPSKKAHNHDTDVAFRLKQEKKYGKRNEETRVNE